LRSVGWLVAGRLAAAVPTMLLVATLIFLVVALLPGDLAAQILGRDATPETLENLREQLGLDRPLLTRYLHWLAALAQGDFGTSLASGRDVKELIGPHLLNTLFLAGLAALIAVPLSLALGILAALWRDTLFDRIVSSVTLSAISLPDFFVAYLFILALAVQLPIFPSIASIDPSMPMAEQVWRSLLPALTLTMLVMAPMMRMTRVAIINTLSSVYIEMAHLKGVSPLNVILRHALPNVVAPVVTVVMFNLGYLIVGVVIIEVVFAYPGLGQLLVDSVSKRDVPVVQACSLAFAATYILLNLVADTVSLASDPRRLYRQ
jgi:peptide/nickel transport system permease protein